MHMATPRTQRKPTFFWQAALILLPVAVLAVISLVSLRQDERAAEQDARNRAAENVQSLARAMRSSVNDELQRFLTLQNVWMMELYSASQPSVSMEFPNINLTADIEKWERDYPGRKLAELAIPLGQILSNGRQIQPLDFPAVPAPPKWFLELSPEQKELWESYRAATSPAQSETRRDKFLNSKPSAEAQQAAFYASQPPEKSGGALLPTETGISFEAIGCYRLLSATNARLTFSLFQSVWWEVIERPSLVSPRLLELALALTNRAGADVRQKFVWTQQYWNRQSQAREWLVPLRGLPELTNHWDPPAFWAHWSGDPSAGALAFFKPCTFTNMGSNGNGVPFAGRGYEVWFAPRDVIKAIFGKAMAENKFLIPGYVRAAVLVEGRPLLAMDGKDLTKSQALLGSATQTFGCPMMPDGAQFELNLSLMDRVKMLFAERRRAKLIIALILGTVFAAMAGLLAAWRAFRRQLQLNETKSNFVSSVSHELRAPIASVRLMAENLEGDKIPEPGKQKEYFRFIGQECRRLSALIENVLDFSRIEQGRKQYELEPTDLVSLTQTTVRLMEPYAAEKGVNLQLNPASGQSSATKFELEVDGRAIQQALVNLIDNAIKHSAKGQTVTLGIEAGSQSSFNLSVSDQGPGIPKAEQEKIFERFHRLGSELRRETQGIGIGLSIVKHIVEAHGGRVTVESEPGQGTRFTINLPAKQ